MPTIECPYNSCSYATPELGEDLLKTLLTAHLADAHTTAPAAATCPIEKVRRPNIEHGGSTADWKYFETRWKQYVEATGITGKSRVIQLLECCDEPLRKAVTTSAEESLMDKSMDEVLSAIKKLAVKEENPMLSRIALQKMKQEHGENIRTFGSRLQSQASICKFTIPCLKCNEEVDYSDAVLRDVLITGLEDQDIQAEILSSSDQDMSLDKVFKMIETKESGKITASKLNSEHTVNAASSYKKKRISKTMEQKLKYEKPREGACGYCGQRGHGKSAKFSLRRTMCPAFDYKCKICHIKHHFDKMCKSKSNSELVIESESESEAQESEAIIFNNDGVTEEEEEITMARTRGEEDEEGLIIAGSPGEEGFTMTGASENAANLEHHCFDKEMQKWTKRRPDPQPLITLKASTSKKDYEHFGYRLNSEPASADVEVMADTGCQCTLAGLGIMAALNMKSSDLIPVQTKMRAANREPINIIGGTVIRFSSTDSSGHKVETKQIVYITDSTDKIFLSKGACIDLGIISPQFPLISKYASYSMSDSTCSCPRRDVPPPLPRTLPCRATEDNVPKLKKFLLDYYGSSTFNICEHQPLPMMDGPPMELMIDREAKPVAYHTPLPIPIHWHEEVKKSIDRDVRLGVIEPVPVGEPVTWCHRMVVCAKKNGKPRRTVDLQGLNAYATRETHHTMSPFHQARSVPAGTKKSIFDAWNGYHSVAIREEDRHYTTFITPWGRYRYCVAPQGYIASGDGYSRRYDEIVAEIPNKTKCIDDTIMWSSTIEESFHQAANWLDVCGRNGITLNPDKFVFAEDNVEFAGFEITKDSVKPGRKYSEAISNFPRPRTITDIRSWFGLINQVSYAFSMTKIMLPFRKLLKPNTKFEWTNELETTFEKSKEIIVREIKEGVRIFDKNKPTCLSTDWSKDGIGFWLSQKHCKCHSERVFCCKEGWKTTLIGGRFTSAAEARYAPIEGEALAVAEGLDKARYFVLGCSNLIVAVDHKPLLKIFGNRSLDEIPNTRLRNLKEKTLRYKFQMTYVPGAKQKAADAISRNPSGTSQPQTLHLPDDIACVTSRKNICFEEELKDMKIAAINDFRPITWEKIQSETLQDNKLRELLNTIEIGIPQNKSNMHTQIKEYHKYRSSLCVLDGVILYKDRVLVPTSLRTDVLQTLHSAHQGVASMQSRAEASVFWPGITRDIAKTRENCKECHRVAPSQPAAPPFPVTMAEYPFQCICADYFSYKGVNYLVVVDRFSNWPIIEKAANGASGLVKCLRSIFTTYGIPNELASDGGKEFTAHETRKFLSNWQVDHRISSVAFPHSNCRAELGVKTAKRLIINNTNSDGSLNNDRFHRALLQYRNTPDKETKISPALCLFGRNIRDFMPSHPKKFKPHTAWEEALRARETAMKVRCMRTAEYWREHTKKLKPLKVGDSVWIQNQVGPNPNKWDKTGVVIEVRQYDQYIVKVDGSGRATLRNRKFLRQFSPLHLRRTPTSNVPSNAAPSDRSIPFDGFERPAAAARANRPPEPMPSAPQDENCTTLRKSTRIKRRPDFYVAN